MIFWFCAFYGMTVVSVLWMIVRGEYKHRRRCRFHDLIPQALVTNAVIVSAVSSCEQRLSEAFSKWTTQRAKGDLSIAVIAASEPVPEKPEPQAESAGSSLDTRQKHSDIALIEDNSDFGLTALGVDYVESHSCTNTLIRELLTVGSGAVGQRSEPALKPIRKGRRLRRRRDASAGRFSTVKIAAM